MSSRPSTSPNGMGQPSLITTPTAGAVSSSIGTNNNNNSILSSNPYSSANTSPTSSGVVGGGGESHHNVISSSSKDSLLLSGPFDAMLKHERPWSIKDIGSNAISEVLNDPNAHSKKSQQTFKAFVDINNINLNPFDNLSNITHPSIRKVRAYDFEPYIKSLADVIDKYQYHRAVGISVVTEGAPELGELGMKAITSARDKRRKKGAIQGSLKDVPTIFFESNFTLGNPYTYYQITDNIPLTSSAEYTSTEANTTLQEKLSKYLDIIEVNLVTEISNRSLSFFSALTNLQELHQETASCMNQINRIRHQLHDISNKTAQKGLNLIQSNRRKVHITRLLTGVSMISEIKNTKPTIQSLLNQNELIAALDLISAALKGVKTSIVNAAASDPLSESQHKNASSTAAAKTAKLYSATPSVKALQSFMTQLQEMSQTVGKMLEAELSSTCQNVFEQLTSNIPQSSNFLSQFDNLPPNRLKSIFKGVINPDAGTFISEAKLDDSIKQKLQYLTFALIRMDKVLPAIQIVKDFFIRNAKYRLKKIYPQLTTQQNGVTIDSSRLDRKLKQSLLADHMKSLAFPECSTFLMDLFLTTTCVVEATKLLQDFFIQCLHEANEKGVVVDPNLSADDSQDLSEGLKNIDEEDDELGSVDMLNPKPDFDRKVTSPESAFELGGNVAIISGADTTLNQLISDISNLTYTVGDVLANKCAKLIAVREDQNSRLPVKDFYWLHSRSTVFLKTLEMYTNRSNYSLKATLLTQTKGFIKSFHEEKSKELASKVEIEAWAQVEVPLELQHIIHSLLEENIDSNMDIYTAVSTLGNSADAVQDPTTSVEDLDQTFGYINLNGDSVSPRRLSIEALESKHHVVIQSQKYYAVNSSLQLIKTLSIYVTLAKSLHGISTEIFIRILELLKLFNSRVCQMILGAGALRSAGLKNITARHISLASQTLSVVIHLIPIIKSNMSSLFTEKQQLLLGDLDRIAKDYKEHQSELHAKLIAILSERLDIHAKNIIQINWDSAQEKDIPVEGNPSIHMAQLVKEISTLHRVVSKHLHPDTSRLIFDNIFRNCVQRFEEDWKGIDIFTSAGKKRLLVEAQHFVEKLSALNGTEGPGNHIEVVVNNIRIKDKKNYNPTDSSSRKSTELVSDNHSAKPSVVNNKPALPQETKTTSGGMFSNFKVGMGLGSLGVGTSTTIANTVSPKASTDNIDKNNATASSTTSTADAFKKNMMGGFGFSKILKK